MIYFMPPVITREDSISVLTCSVEQTNPLHFLLVKRFEHWIEGLF